MHGLARVDDSTNNVLFFMNMHGCTGPHAIPGILRTHPARCWSGIAGRTAGCGSHTRHPRRLELGARHRLRQDPHRTGLAGAGATTFCATASSDTTNCPHMRMGMVQQVLRRHGPATPSPTTVTTHGPPCGRGWCRMAGKHLLYVGVAPPPTRTLFLAGVGHCPLANGHGPSVGLPPARWIAGPYRH